MKPKTKERKRLRRGRGRQPDAHFHFGVAGRFTFEVTKADAEGNPIPGTTRKVAACANLITNGGMDSLAVNTNSSADNVWNAVAVGSGTNTPAVTDTALQTEVARTANLFDNSNPVGNSYNYTRQVTTSPRYWSIWKKWRFNTGLAAGNLNEVGVLRGIGTPNYAFCRARIVDAGGNPVTLTILSDEILDVTYEFFVFIPETDVTGSVTLKGTPYTFTMRACSIGRVTDGYLSGWPTIGLSTMQVRGPRAVGQLPLNTSGSMAAVATGASLVPMDQHPIVSQNPTARGADGATISTYVSGSFTLDTTFTWSLTTGNNAALNMLTLNCGLGTFQIYFDGGTFSKDNTERMSFTLRTTWARATPP